MRFKAHVIISLSLILSGVSCKTSEFAPTPTVQFSVTVTGEVHKQGVYNVHTGDTVQDAVNQAGGAYDWPPESGVFNPRWATLTSKGGREKRVARKDWGRHLLKLGDSIRVWRNLL